MLDTLTLQVVANLAEPNNIDLATEFRYIHQELSRQADELEELGDTDDSEHYDTLQYLVDLFKGLATYIDHGNPELGNFLAKFNQRFNWENYEEEDGRLWGTDSVDAEGYYRLGGVFYQRISWATEGCEDVQLKDLLTKINQNEALSKLLNQLERDYLTA